MDAGAESELSSSEQAHTNRKSPSSDSVSSLSSGGSGGGAEKPEARAATNTVEAGSQSEKRKQLGSSNYGGSSKKARLDVSG